MPRSILHIIWALLLLGFTSIVYFLSLPVHLPVWATLLVVVVFGYFSLRWMLGQMPPEVVPVMSRGDVIRAYIVLFIGLCAMVGKSYRIEQQYGYWDAWWLWDHHAKYLQDPVYWRELFRLDDAYHPDYPLFLSSLIAFVWRLMGNFDQSVPYVFSIMIGVLVPCTIFLSLYRKNLLVASMAYLLIAFDTDFLSMALSMYADQPLALLLLGAFVCVEHAKVNKQAVIVVAALLGCCIWMKNEGMLLALVFTAFYAKTLLGKGNAKRYAAGIALPLMTYTFLKWNAPANDLIKGQGSKTFAYLTDADRYSSICKYFHSLLTGQLLPLVWAVGFYFIYCYLERKWPGRNLLLLFTCIIGIGFVYVLTPHDLSWHLTTSANRILYQLIPSFVYVMARNFCNLGIFSNAEQFQ